jgi:predicted dehydrogenase
MKVKNILLIGMGNMGKKYLKIISSNFPTIKISLCRSRENFNQIDKTFRNYRVFDNIADAIKSRPDFAILCNPSSFREKIMKNLIQNNIDILLEKPVSNSIKNIKKFLGMSKSKKLKILVGYNLRYLNSLKFFRRLIQKKSIGSWIKVHSEVGENIKNWRGSKNFKFSASFQKKLGGGVLLELSHEIDYLNWIFGPLKWVQAQTIKNNFHNSNVEHSANLIFGTKIKSNQNLISLNMDFVRHDKTRSCYVIGTKGSLFWDCNKNIVKKFDVKKKKWITIFKEKYDMNSSYVDQISHMINLKQSTKKILPYISFQKGVEVLSIVEASKLSNKKNKTVLIQKVSQK